MPWCSGVCQTSASAGLNSGANCFRGCVGMLSGPMALCGLWPWGIFWTQHDLLWSGAYESINLSSFLSSFNMVASSK